MIPNLQYPVFTNPRVCIIVPAFGNLPVTLRCLESIQAHPPGVSYELIVVDDHSEDASMDQLRDVPGLQFTVNPENIGFIRSCNAATEKVTAAYTYFLNNDTEVTRGWLDESLAIFDRFPRCGLVGSKLLFPDGTLQEAGCIVWVDGSAWNFGRGSEPSRPEFSYVREVDYCSGAALLVRTETFRNIGGFNTDYSPAYYDDADLSFNLRRRGLRTYYCPKSVVIHHEGVSNGTDPSAGIKQYQARNQLKFRQRWRATLEHSHYVNSRDVFRAREHARHKRVLLFVDHTLPQPDRDAGSRAILQTMIAMTRMGLLVKFWPDDQNYAPEHSRRLEEAGIEVVIEPQDAHSFMRYLEKTGCDIDFAVLSRPNFAGPYIEALRRASQARLVYFGHDLHFSRMQAQAVLTGKSVDWEAAVAMQEIETALWSRVDSVIYPSDEEVDLVVEHIPHEKVHQVPLYFFDSEELVLKRGPVDPELVIFVACFGHPPNEDAAEWLVRSIMPGIWRRFPTIRLHLVGSLPTGRVLALAGERVTVTGAVSMEELKHYHQTTSAVIAPMRFGGGVKLKVLEAMARGVPLVTTSIGLQGLDAAGPYLTVADGAESLAISLIDILENPERAQAKADAARDYVRKEHSEQAMHSALWRALVGSMPVNSI